MGSKRRGPHAAPLTRAQADEVLRYWLLALRLEEALQVRPRAQRAKHSALIPRLDFPAPGQEYFKLALDDALDALLADREPLSRSFDGELNAFFEDWLHRAYRRSQDESELSHLLCFPVVHLARGELAGLLRCGVRLQFGSRGGPSFRAPSRADRRNAVYPSPPDQVRIAAVPRGDGSWPFFLDTRLLSYPLGLSSEAIDALLEALRAQDSLSERAMLALVADALERAASERAEAAPDRSAPETRASDDSVSALLTRLVSAMGALLARAQARAEVYPVGIVLDGSQAKTTWHLQRELVSLLEAQGKDAWQLRSCLGAYLTRHPLSTGEAPQRALFRAPALTSHQRSASEHFWGSPLTSVQGPPGTGKTTLILHLCAESIVRQVDSLLDTNEMSADLLVVTSSNNRAVDNVLEPLSADTELPLALRVGSRQVCGQALCSQLRSTLTWLEHAKGEPAALRTQALERALAQFADLRAQLELILGPRKQALSRSSERNRLQQALAALSQEPSRPKQGADGSAPGLSPESARAIDKALIKLELRMSALSALCEVKPSMARVNAVARHYEQTAEQSLPPFEAALAGVGRNFEVSLPPLKTPLGVAALMESWEEGAETFLERLSAVREEVEHALTAEKLAKERANLQAQLRALGEGPDAPLPASGGHDELSRELFSAAVAVREAWAKVHATVLKDALEAALEAAEQERSLRVLFRNDPERATLLCRLFGVWGSTLLSLGNCLPAHVGGVARVVIDEAGQCHPAHAISALMRCRSAMIIGDVHQLAPVIELTKDDEARLLRASRLKLSAESLVPYRVSSDSHVSAQSLAEQGTLARHSLVDHFRCQPEIIAICDALCSYGLNVHTARAQHTACGALLGRPVSLLDLRGNQERLLGSLYNELELQETLALVDALLARGAAPSEIAVITPYRGQLERLRRGFLERRVPLELSPELADSDASVARGVAGLALGTVHRFQGGERSIVLFSSVVTRATSLPFLNARPNLLNVAISRARHHFVCLGDRGVLLQGRMTRLLVEAAAPR